MLKVNVTAQDFCDMLNELLKLDYDCINNIISHRIKCNDMIADHPTVQCTSNNELGMIGILNGFFGTDKNGKGLICMEMDDYGKIFNFMITPGVEL